MDDLPDVIKKSLQLDDSLSSSPNQMNASSRKNRKKKNIKKIHNTSAEAIKSNAKLSDSSSPTIAEMPHSNSVTKGKDINLREKCSKTPSAMKVNPDVSSAENGKSSSLSTDCSSNSSPKAPFSFRQITNTSTPVRGVSSQNSGSGTEGNRFQIDEVISKDRQIAIAGRLKSVKH